MSTKQSKERCSGSYPALWRIKFQFTQQIRASVYGTGETEKVGEQLAVYEYDVVSITPEMAMLTLTENCPIYAPGNKDFKVLGPPEFICFVDAITLTQHNYGGHFS